MVKGLSTAQVFFAYQHKKTALTNQSCFFEIMKKKSFRMFIFQFLHIKKNLKIIQKSINLITVSYLFDLECVTLVKLLNNETKV